MFNQKTEIIYQAADAAGGRYEEGIQARRSGLRQLRRQDGEERRKVGRSQFGQRQFYVQRMSIDADESRFDEIMDEVVRVCRKVEPDCRIVR